MNPFNPFKIQNDVNINNLKGSGRNSTKNDFLKEAIQALPVDPNKSIFISDKQYAKNSISTIANTLVKEINKDITDPTKQIVIAKRTITDVTKKYVGTRIFRIQ